MSSIGVEVGQKMRSAIKAKLTELDCYVDDELPDYIMVMIANKRTRSQMKEDLQLFLTSQTATFVEWLHIVLKKLKEVQVSNPEVFKQSLKRKSDGNTSPSPEDLKKIKKEKKEENKALKKARKDAKASKELQRSLTDDLPITANKLSEARKIVVMKENQMNHSSILSEKLIDEDSFDIPLLSEINTSNEEELELIEQKIRNVKNRLGLQVSSDDDDYLNIKADPDDLLLNDQLKKPKERHTMQRKITVDTIELVEYNDIPEISEKDQSSEKRQHERITFDKEKDSIQAKYISLIKRAADSSNQNKRKSVLERLGKRNEESDETNLEKRLKHDKTRSSSKSGEDMRNKLNSKIKEKEQKETNEHEKSVLNKLGVMSKVLIPIKKPITPAKEADEEEQITRKEVLSIVQLKPRVLPPKSKQANPNLLFKAVAEAQRSVSQAPKVGSILLSPEKKKEISNPALFTKSYKEKLENKFSRKAKLLDDEKNKLKVLLSNAVSENNENFNEDFYSQYEESREDIEENVNISHKFIVTLDGIEKTKFTASKEGQRSIVKTKRTPSPIVFDKSVPTKISNVDDKFPIRPVLKVKERCKFWPNCRLGCKCDYAHPSMPCKMFPNCKFEDKCLYMHPPCKFENSCTRRDCPYSHISKNATRIATAPSLGNQKLLSQICKFFPKCNNLQCIFYHPRVCKFGVFCKNQSDCNFIHSAPSKAANLTWRPDK